MTTIEIAPMTEHVAAVFTSPNSMGESYDDPLVIGYYPNELNEIFIEWQGKRMNVQVRDIPDLAKQLKRAGRIASEQVVQS